MRVLYDLLIGYISEKFDIAKHLLPNLIKDGIRVYAYNTIEYKLENKVATVTLNRPEVRNAINTEMVDELLELFKYMADTDKVRVIVITGAGKSFCAGADMNWLKSIAEYDYDRNYYESLNLVNLLYLLQDHPKPIIAKVNGSAVGGGVGLMLVSDIIFVEENAKFGLSEVAMGIVPVAIAPFVMRRIGETKTREYLLTGERIDALEAYNIGLVNHIYPANNLNYEVNKMVDILLNNGPEALKNVKSLINRINKGKFDK